MKSCSQCGQEFDGERSLCSQCLESSQSEAPSEYFKADPPSTGSTLFYYFLIGFALIILGVFLCGKMTVNAYRSRGSKQWPTVSGFVTDSSIETLEGRRGRQSYRDHVSYKYTLNEINDIGERVYFGDGWTFIDKLDAEKFIKPYVKQKEVKVHYDPNNPDNAVL